jgi:hypothetical protein
MRNPGKAANALTSEANAQAARQRGVVERLHAERVTRQVQGLAARVPQGEREHAGKARQKVAAPLHISLQQHLAVAARHELVSE